MEVKDYRAINSPEDINWALFLTSCKLWVLALPEEGQEMYYFDKWETLGDASAEVRDVARWASVRVFKSLACNLLYVRSTDHVFRVK